jgi:hypothetical protein
MILEKTFTQSALQRADHHAKSVKDIIPNIIGNLHIYGDIKKHRTNVCWFEVNTKPYYVRYNHDNKKIEFLEKNNKGSILFSCDEKTNNKEINNFFESLL